MITKCITDNDGVNADSEDLAMRIMDDWGVRFIQRYAPDQLPPQDYIYETYPGTSTDRIVRALIEKFALPLDTIRADYGVADDVTDIAAVSLALAEQVTIETISAFEERLPALAGVVPAWRQVIDVLGHENIALATTSPAGRMDVTLEQAKDPVTGTVAGLAEIFPVGERRRSGYGFDNKYHEAFGALGWNPAETVIVEDSISGVSKAQAADAGAIIGTVAAKFYVDKVAQAEKLIEAGAHVVISHMHDLPKAVLWAQAGFDPAQKPAFSQKIYTAADSAQPGATAPAQPAPVLRSPAAHLTP